MTKDGDTLLQSPNLPQILAEARDLYDTTARTHYRHGLSKDYAGVRCTWILCGTSSLHQLDHSELGERFLDCVIMAGIDEDLEDEILRRVAYRTERGLSHEANGKLEGQYDPDLLRAMRLTGGYVAHLRNTAREALDTTVMPTEALEQCIQCAKLIAHLRAQPSARQKKTAERELAARLVSQMVRLAKCLAVVIQRPTVDATVLERVRKVALDSSQGTSYRICRHLNRAGRSAGVPAADLAHLIHEDATTTEKYLNFLAKIKVAEKLRIERVQGIRQERWRLTRCMEELYREVAGRWREGGEGENAEESNDDATD